MILEDFLREQHKRIRLLKLSMRGPIADRLFSIVQVLEDKAIEVFNMKKWQHVEGLVFSFSKRQMAAALGLNEDSTKRYLILAAALGLVKRVTPEEAHGNSEYWDPETGIGIQQYTCVLIDRELVRERWRTWNSRPRRIRDITIQKMRDIFGSEVGYEINTHPEATDFWLRQQLRMERLKDCEEMAKEVESDKDKLKKFEELDKALVIQKRGLLSSVFKKNTGKIKPFWSLKSVKPSNDGGS